MSLTREVEDVTSKKLTNISTNTWQNIAEKIKEPKFRQKKGYQQNLLLTITDNLPKKQKAQNSHLQHHSLMIQYGQVPEPDTGSGNYSYRYSQNILGECQLSIITGRKQRLKLHNK